jgi:hypothetical protein
MPFRLPVSGVLALALALSTGANAQAINYSGQQNQSVDVAYFNLPANTRLAFVDSVTSLQIDSQLPPVSGSGTATIPFSVLPIGISQVYVLAHQSGAWIAQTVNFYAF